MFPSVETDFGLSMLRYAPSNVSMVVSPISVIFALAMIEAGSKGTTKSQINSVIAKGKGRGASDNEVEEYYSKLFHQITNSKNGVKSRIANGFFLDKQFKVENDYEQTIKKAYEAKVEALDFGRAKEAAKVIDDFIANTTEGKISDMVNEGSVEGAYSLIVNAIYFTAEWEFKFYKTSNSNGTFYRSAGNERQVEYMNDFDEHRLYAEDNDLQVLSLQYLDTSYALNIFLPKSRFGLNEVRSKLTGERIQSLLSKLKQTYISISIPKMKIETDFKLKKALIGMGVTAMFSDNANLTGISKEPPLKVSDAAHKAIIEVDEDGTTAAAATFFKIVPLSAVMEEPVKFEANHPFLFILTKDKNPLFMGQFVMFLTAETDLGLSMLRCEPSNVSLVVSPISVIFTLAMVHAGSKGTTRSELESVISKGQEHGLTLPYFSDISLLATFVHVLREKFATWLKKRMLKVEYMNGSDQEMLHAEDDDVKVLSLPYVDTSYALNIFLPKSRFGLHEVRARLTGERVQSLLSKLEKTKISITIPKMKIETGFNLKKALKDMGVTNSFSTKADFTGIIGRRLLVAGAAHRATIKVDEDGTTAAAGTVFTRFESMSAIVGERVKFEANHPFLFILTKDHNPLFMGQFV
ncbi:unnamed protein product [Haemonchus placei]|uniref:SERPIN domain-containing protein n=1 Tax=Haemonchus placei TaxID=6290 RepID=A0A0N4WRW1_HAEPC|nr:unnamed protein product [Haemonchus placei]